MNSINNLDFSTALTNVINWSLLPEGASASSSVEMLNEDLSALIPSLSRKGGARQINKKNCNLNSKLPNRLKRRKLYTKCQKLLCNSRTKSETVKSILNDTFGKDSKLPKLKSVEPFWKGLFETPSVPDSRIGNCNDKLVRLLDPITLVELEGATKCTTGAPGPDGISWKLVKEKSKQLLHRFNWWLLVGRCPDRLLLGETSLIPKDPLDTQDPAKYRPITVASTIIRCYHKILAKRFERELPIDPLQRGFKTGDGVAINSFALDYAIFKSKSKYKNLNLCFVDVAKAFDSVSHDSIKYACKKLGVPDHLINYISHFYQNSSTCLKFNSERSESIKVTRGIKQGDPLSVHLFNAVVNLATSKLNDRFGFSIDSKLKLKFLAFADDLVLLADSQVGLQKNLDILIEEFGLSGLKLNVKKCSSMAIKCHKKKWVCLSRPFLSANSQPISTLSITDTYRYLGLQTGPLGAKFTKFDQLMQLISNVSKAPPKPQQRLDILKTNIIPQLIHQLVSAPCSALLLKNLDIRIRKAVNRWLCLPNASPLGYFYAPVGAGGLGLPRLRTNIPVLKSNRWDKLLYFDHPVINSFKVDLALCKKD